MNNNELYFNRELSWLEFNHRVMMQALAKENPVFERMKFLSIVSSNLDEFFMIRAASIRDQIRAKYQKTDDAGYTPKQQYAAISKRAHIMADMQYSIYNESILSELKQNGIRFLKPFDLDYEQSEFTLQYFKSTIYPVLTPLTVDLSHPFPLILNKSLNLGVLLKPKGEKKEEDYIFSTVQVPSVLPRLVSLPSEEGEVVIMYLEDIIRMYIDTVFTGYRVLCCHPYRITRNGDLSLDEEDAVDLLSEIKKSLKQRKWGSVIRLEIESGSSNKLLDALVAPLKLDKKEIYQIDGPINLSFLAKELYSIPGFDCLKDEPLVPYLSEELKKTASIFDCIKAKDIILHHPYDSFDPVLRLLTEAAEDPKVLAIKQTLYRVSGNSPVVAALAKAADRGKPVTALIEVKARFDEEHNIKFGERLAQAGAHIIYGVAGLKTHSKITLIVRREEDGIRRYLHLGTGNYNDITAKIYTDYSLMTANEELGEDATDFFNCLTGTCDTPELKRLVMAPTMLRSTFAQLIRHERHVAEKGGKAEIFAKMNSLVDDRIIRSLYKASSAGVKIRLLVRGICCLKPGVPGLSENIEVRSIVGRFLEHSRVYHFYNEGRDKLFLSSADWMTRNMDRRVELLFPVLQEDIRQRILADMDLYWSDNVKSKILQKDGQYRPISPFGKQINAQEQLLISADKAQAFASPEEAVEENNADSAEVNAEAEFLYRKY
ncbi:MAG: RNA degradosome polyphosphate kinase [Oscillospiraceae bacterium]|jgi:polyphosphate kinase|nr:RNA degradosome polyphosphate kinase [Oscillospiraceae bacterium]